MQKKLEKYSDMYPEYWTHIIRWWLVSQMLFSVFFNFFQSFFYNSTIFFGFWLKHFRIVPCLNYSTNLFGCEFINIFCHLYLFLLTIYKPLSSNFSNSRPVLNKNSLCFLNFLRLNTSTI